VAAGYFGGAVSWAVTSLADLIFAVPSVLLALAIVSGLGPGWQNTAIAVGISYTPIFIKAGYAADGSTRVEPEYEATEIRLVKALS
jgi:peptide/nickel transport system permease protein